VSFKTVIMAAAAISAVAAGAAFAQGQQNQPKPPMTFFVTGETQTGNLGGLAGADAICQRLAQAAGADNHTWHAYLSTQATEGQPAVNARDRIGPGPWYSASGDMIARNVAELHGDLERDRNYIYKDTALTEKGEHVPSRGDPVNEHDMLTGSNSLGYAFPPGEDRTCHNWTYDGVDGHAMLGHSDRNGGGTTSWNSAHASRGCDVETLKSTGGAGRFYCFAIN
jgi:hypothetical protein